MTPSRRIEGSTFWVVFGPSEVVPGLKLREQDTAVFDDRVGFVGMLVWGRPRVFDLRAWREFYEACRRADMDLRAEWLAEKVREAGARLDAQREAR